MFSIYSKRICFYNLLVTTSYLLFSCGQGGVGPVSEDVVTIYNGDTTDQATPSVLTPARPFYRFADERQLNGQIDEIKVRAGLDHRNVLFRPYSVVRKIQISKSSTDFFLGDVADCARINDSATGLSVLVHTDLETRSKYVKLPENRSLESLQSIELSALTKEMAMWLEITRDQANSKPFPQEAIVWVRELFPYPIGYMSRRLVVPKGARLDFSVTFEAPLGKINSEHFPPQAYVESNLAIYAASTPMEIEPVRVSISLENDNGQKILLSETISTSDWKDTAIAEWKDYSIDLSEFAGEVVRFLFQIDRVAPLQSETDLLKMPSAVFGNPILYSTEETPKRRQQPNVLIFLIDTLRMDHVSTYGYERETTPNLDRFAKDAIQFSHLIPQSSWTKPSVASLLTSAYPNIHGAQDGQDILRQDLPTLAGALRAAGYTTHALSTNINVLPMWGFANGFDRFVDVDAHQWAELDDTQLVDRCIETIRNANDRPWFVYAHAMGPHDPYTPPPPFDTRFVRDTYTGTEEEQAWQRALDQYDGEIAFTDQQFGRLLDALKELDLYQNTLIIVLSDHGEEFGERGGEHHGTTLHEEQLRIPLIVKFPGNAHAGEQRSALLEIVDVAPSILEIVEAPPEPRFQGASFMDMVEDATLDTRIGFASLRAFKYSMRSAMTSDLKYIHDLVAQEESWYNLATDPHELHPLADPGTPSRMLARHVDRVASRGAHGFHLLMTFGTQGDYTIEGQIAGAGMQDFTLNYYDWKSEVSRDGDTVRFALHTRDPEDADHNRQVWRAEHAEQDHAHLIVDSSLDQPITITLTVNGELVGEDVSFTGATRTPTLLDGTSFNPIDMLATPDDFDPAALPERFAVYIWYVPEGETRAIDTLDEETIEALRGLGYLE